MQTAAARFNAQAEAIANGQKGPEEMARLIESQRAFEANAAVAKAANKTAGTLLNTLA